MNANRQRGKAVRSAIRLAAAHAGVFVPHTPAFPAAPLES